MSNNQAYQRSLFDDARYQLEGTIQSGAKWPAQMSVKPAVDEYKGYTNSYVRFVVRTNIEGDRNNGIVEVKAPVQNWYTLGQLLQGLTGENITLPSLDCYEKPFGRDKKPSKEPVLMGKVNVGVRDGRIFICIVDARANDRVKIPFYFGTPNSRVPFSTFGEKGDFSVAKAAALGWHEALSSILPDAFKDMHARALKRSTTMDRGEEGGGNNGGGNSNNNQGYQNNSPSTNEVDDDLPF